MSTAPRIMATSGALLVVVLWCLFLATAWFGFFFVGLFVTTLVALAITFFW
jgi:hypothetical protein